MKGCRPLSEEEVNQILNSFSGKFAQRDKALFLMGVRSGFRISELLSLQVKDIIQHGKVVEKVNVERKYMKKKTEGRTVRLNPLASQALLTWLGDLNELHPITSETFIFQSRKGSNKPLSTRGAQKFFQKACDACGLTGKTGTHSMRKTYANKAYEHFNGDILKVQKALGHKNINSTTKYISFKEEEIDEFVMSM